MDEFLRCWRCLARDQTVEAAAVNMVTLQNCTTSLQNAFNSMCALFNSNRCYTVNMYELTAISVSWILDILVSDYCLQLVSAVEDSTSASLVCVFVL